MAARFELFQDPITGQIGFRFIAGNGQLVAQSVGFRSKRDVLEALEQLRSTALERYAIDLTTTPEAAGYGAPSYPPQRYPAPDYGAAGYGASPQARQKHEDPTTTQDWEKDKDT